MCGHEENVGSDPRLVSSFHTPSQLQWDTLKMPCGREFGASVRSAGGFPEECELENFLTFCTH